MINCMALKICDKVILKNLNGPCGTFYRINIRKYSFKKDGYLPRKVASAEKLSKKGIRSKPIDPEHALHMEVMKYVKENNLPAKKIYVWGNASFGALGAKKYLRPNRFSKYEPFSPLEVPARLSFGELHHVKDFACGYGFTIFAVSNNKEAQVFGTGLNTDSQLGFHEARRNHPLEVLIEPVPIHIPFPEGSQVIQVAAGRAHTLILTNLGNVFSIGNNAFGQCGRPIVEDENYFGSKVITLVKAECDGSIRNITCGQDHSLFITNEGHVYACGWSADGQTGIGLYNNVSNLTRCKGDILGEKIVKVSSAADCVLALSDKGEVFGWGNSEYSQLATSTDEQQISEPRHLKLNLGRITDIAASGSSCMVLNSEGKVFAWGYGILGLGPKVQKCFNPTELPAALFGKNEFDMESQVKSISSGLSHYAAITNKGYLYMWGHNRSCCLGLRQKTDQYFPLKVAIGGSVSKVSLGIDHSVAVVQSWA